MDNEKWFVLSDVHLCGNEESGLRPDVLYAELRHEDSGDLAISATLEYILAAIRDRNLNVRGVTTSKMRGESRIRLDHYQ